MKQVYTHLRFRVLGAVLSCFAAALLCYGCRDAEVDITMTGDLLIESCGQFLPWSPAIAGFTQFENQGVFRIYGKEGLPPTLNNTFAVTVRDVRLLRETLGTPQLVELTLEDKPAEFADASLIYFEFCRDVRPNPLPVLFEGTITFDEFGTSIGDRIRGSMEGVFRDGRRPFEVVGTDINVTFSFLYRINEPYQPFPPN